MNVEEHKAKVELMAERLNESTKASWLWAFLFGPIYFAAHGFWGKFFLVLLLNLCFFIGVIVAPFLAYPAWRSRAREKAEKMIAAGVDLE